MKKYVLFLVEGKNDKKEIQAIIRAWWGSSFLDNYVDEYHVHKGDITSEKGTTEKTILKKLNDIVVEWRNGSEHPYQRITTSEVKKVIHIVDTDGVFIPDSSIIQTDDEKAQYFDDEIRYVNRSLMIGRNHCKASVLRKLMNVKQIDNIPYELYFASCNMDHLLFNDRNSILDNKSRNAMIFASECKNKEYLKSTIFSEKICINSTNGESWDFIQKGYNSLNRFTNINILLNSIN